MPAVNQGRLQKIQKKIPKLKKGSKIHSFYQEFKKRRIVQHSEKSAVGSIEGRRLCTDGHCAFSFPKGPLSVAGMWPGEASLVSSALENCGLLQYVPQTETPEQLFVWDIECKSSQLLRFGFDEEARREG